MSAPERSMQTLAFVSLLMGCGSAPEDGLVADAPGRGAGGTPAASEPATTDNAAPSIEDGMNSPGGAGMGNGPSAAPSIDREGSAVGTIDDASIDNASAPNGSDGPSAVASPGDCTSLPALTDYAARGPFDDARMFERVGPGSNYTLFRPDASLGRDGFRHPIGTWGNGISTTPDQYQETLRFIASHGFVVIACNDTQAERPCLTEGLDWLVEQNSVAGALQGKLDPTREVTIGYSWGGGAAIDAADRPNVKATVSLHGMPPRGASAFQSMHSPLLLFTSTGDTFVSAAGYVTPNYEKSTVTTFYATLDDATAGHLYVVDAGAAICVGALLGLGACETAIAERAPTLAWLRHWACGDADARHFFYGDDCVLCSAPWAAPQRKQLP